eukprot:13183040-Ditylum_brightwellii.AAC.1
MKEGGSVENFPGIEIMPNSDDAFKLTQSGLIDKVLASTGMEDCNPVKVPTHASGPLGPDPQGKDPQPQKMWKYASVVGMLMYLASNSRPDTALLYINLQDSLTPQSTPMSRQCYRSTNADFAGFYSVEDLQDPISDKSRTGYVLTFAGCPILW